MRAPWFAFLLAGVLSGCLSSTPSAPEVPDIEDVLYFAGPPLWADPQNAPHTAYNWPTLSHPSVNGTLPDWWQPINATPLPNPIAGLQHLATSSDVSSGAGIALFGSLAVVPQFGAGEGVLLDISDPTAPSLLSSFSNNGRGAATIAYPDGSLVAVISTGSGFDVIDITDPLNPDVLKPVRPSQGGHKLGVVPGTPIVYNAASAGGSAGAGHLLPSESTGYTEIYDLTNPEKPKLVQEFRNGYSCHHIFFWNNASQNRFRAICAGIEFTQIWDTKDPLKPVVLANIPVHHGVAATPSGSIPLEAFSHTAGFNTAGTVLYVGDENGGGGVPPGCVWTATTPSGDVSVPVGATWFYDIKDERNPRLLGWYSPANDPRIKNPVTSCTTHHGRIVPDPARDLLAMSYYGAGVVLIDFTGMDAAAGRPAKVVDQFADGSNTWETWYNRGYLFTGDLSRGFDVLKFR